MKCVARRPPLPQAYSHFLSPALENPNGCAGRRSQLNQVRILLGRAVWIASEHRNRHKGHRANGSRGNRASRRSAPVASVERRGRFMQRREQGGPQERRMPLRLVEQPGPAQEEPVPCQQPVLPIRKGRGQGGPGLGQRPHDPPH